MQKLSLLFLGPPGVGKGTYGKRIAARLGLPLVTAGDLIRDQIKLKTDFGLKFKEVAERGELINPLEVNKLMKQRLREADCDKGSQTSKLADFHKDFPPLSLLVNIALEERYLIPKLLGRRLCPKCGNSYNIADIRDDANGHSDLCECGTGLTQRADDTEEVVRTRLAVYEKETAPLQRHYAARTPTVDFLIRRGLDDLDELYGLVCKAIGRTPR